MARTHWLVVTTAIVLSFAANLARGQEDNPFGDPRDPFGKSDGPPARKAAPSDKGDAAEDRGMVDSFPLPVNPFGRAYLIDDTRDCDDASKPKHRIVGLNRHGDVIDPAAEPQDDPGHPDVPLHVPSNSAAEKRVREALESPTRIEMVEMPLADCLEFLKDLHQIEIQLDQSVADSGVAADTPITRTVKGIALKSALRLILDELDLAYVVRDEVLLITSKQAAAEMLELQVYNVATWLGDEIDADEAAQMLEQLAGSQDRGSLSVVPFRTTLIVRASQQDHEAIVALFQAIQRQLAPE